MYINENLSLNLNNLNYENESYASIMASILDFNSENGKLSTLISEYDASLYLNEDANNTQNADNSANSNSTNTNNNSGFSAKMKELGTKIMSILQKIVAKIKSFISTLWQKLKEIAAQLKEKIEKIGVKATIEKMTAKPTDYTYNDSYFNEKVKDAEFNLPLSNEIIKAYTNIANGYKTAIDDIKNNKYQGDLSKYITDQLNKELENIQNAKKTGADFTSNPAYFANNIQQALGLINGLVASLENNKFETVCKPYIDVVNANNNTIDSLSKSLKSDLDRASHSNNNDEVKNIQNKSKALVSIGSAIAKLSGQFRIQIIGMNISRLKIINTFIKLWKYSENNNTDTTETKTENTEKTEASKAENVNDAAAP